MFCYSLSTYSSQFRSACGLIFKTLFIRINKHKKEYTGDYEVKLTPQDLQKFCQIDWVSFKVEWPSKGSLDRETIHRVYQIVTGSPGTLTSFPGLGSDLRTTVRF
jgi:hypothetical protein